MFVIRHRRLPVLAIVCAAAVAAAGGPATLAQSGSQNAIASGQNIAPVYEGWEPNADGSFDLVFGYMNRNWEEEIDVPVGPENTLEPAGPDRSQPTHFFPRRNRFVFRVRVPSDFGAKEIVWTLTTHGRTERAYGTLKPDYVIDDVVIMANVGAGGQLGTTPDLIGNKRPVLALESDRTRTVKVGEPLLLTAVATDDGKPRTRAIVAGVGSNRTLPNSATGLRVSWFVYRGMNSAVVFDPPQTKVWEDTRDGGNSPWSLGWRTPPVPEGNRWVARAKFTQPGTYVLRCLAHDGGLSAFEDISVVVN
jgi:hypothetical protein